MEGYKIVEFLRKHWRILGILFIVFLITITASNYGFISVKVSSGATNGEFTYQILNQNSQGATKIHTNSKNIKKLVRKSSYEVSVTQEGKNSFQVTKVNGFLAKTSVNAHLKPENSRKFVGNNPKSCMYYLGDVLYSYDCSGQFSNIQIHLPATSNQPTYTTKISSNFGGSIEGITRVEEGTVALLSTSGSEEAAGKQSAYSFADNLVAKGNPSILSDLDSAKTYSILSYKKGFLAYDTKYKDVFYYSSAASKPDKIRLQPPSKDTLIPYLLSVKGESIMVVSSDKAGFQEQSGTRPIGKVNTEVSVYDKGSVKRFNFNQLFSSVRLCGTNKLCSLVSKQLSVYDISGRQANLLFTLSNVINLADSNNGLRIIRDDGIVNLDVDSRSGFTEYSFGDYKFCGLQTAHNSYLLCMTNPASKNVALQIDQTADNRDSIDKKIAALQKLPEIKNISMYGEYVFISPELGEMTYQESLKSFGYNPATTKVAATKINQAIDKIGIDRNKYQITIIGAP